MGMVSDVDFEEMAKKAPVKKEQEVATADLKQEVMIGAMEDKDHAVKEDK